MYICAFVEKLHFRIDDDRKFEIKAICNKREYYFLEKKKTILKKYFLTEALFLCSYSDGSYTEPALAAGWAAILKYCCCCILFPRAVPH